VWYLDLFDMRSRLTSHSRFGRHYSLNQDRSLSSFHDVFLLAFPTMDPTLTRRGYGRNLHKVGDILLRGVGWVARPA